MKLICESGSTKADWILISGGRVASSFQTEGLNPVHLSEEDLKQKIFSSEDIKRNAANFKSVFFFGAGCGNEEGRARMLKVLGAVFPSAAVNAESDLSAAAIATCGNTKGLVSILGTGSNCCYYDGRQVHEKNFGLGFILGDEGSGAWFGKELLRGYLYSTLPEEIRQSFFKAFRLDRSQIIDRIYRQPGANLFLSSFMPFLVEHRSHQAIEELLTIGIRIFFNTNIAGFPESRTYPLHFVGSVAAELENEIKAIASMQNYSVGKIIRRPIEELTKM